MASAAIKYILSDRCTYPSRRCAQLNPSAQVHFIRSLPHAASLLLPCLVLLVFYISNGFYSSGHWISFRILLSYLSDTNLFLFPLSIIALC